MAASERFGHIKIACETKDDHLYGEQIRAITFNEYGFTNEYIRFRT